MIEFIFGAIGFLLTLVFAIPYFLVAMWATAKLARKAGFSGWWGLVALIPPLWLILLWLFAFIDWPTRARVRYR